MIATLRSPSHFLFSNFAAKPFSAKSKRSSRQKLENCRSVAYSFLQSDNKDFRLLFKEGLRGIVSVLGREPRKERCSVEYSSVFSSAYCLTASLPHRRLGRHLMQQGKTLIKKNLEHKTKKKHNTYPFRY